MISILLLKKIISLYIILLLGFFSVRFGLLSSADGKVISTFSLYIITPCTIISSMCVDHSPLVLKGLLIATAAAIFFSAIPFLLSAVLQRPLKLSVTDKTALEYPNAGNLTIPLVTAILGPEYVIYSLGYIVVQTCLIWTHLNSAMSGQRRMQVKKIFTNVNILSVLAGLVIFFLNIQLPDVINDAVSSLSAMIGPTTMYALGMVIGGADLKKAFSNRRVWLLAACRLLLVPLVTLPFLRLFGASSLIENASSIFLITLLAVAAPTGASITLLAQMYSRDTETVSAVNIVSTLCCIGTMPLMVWLYQL